MWIFFCYLSNITLLDSHLTLKNYKKNFRKNILDSFTNLWIAAFSLFGLFNDWSMNSNDNIKIYNSYCLSFLILSAIYQIINYGNILEKIYQLGAAIFFIILGYSTSSFSYLICLFCLILYGPPSFFDNIIQILHKINYFSDNTCKKISKFIYIYIKIPLLVSYMSFSYLNLMIKCGN